MMHEADDTLRATATAAQGTPIGPARAALCVVSQVSVSVGVVGCVSGEGGHRCGGRGDGARVVWTTPEVEGSVPSLKGLPAGRGGSWTIPLSLDVWVPKMKNSYGLASIWWLG